jgi:serine/threonine-protein kinase
MPDTKRGLPTSRSDRPRTTSEVRPSTERSRTQIGPYQLITKIGEGGMGTVWLTKLPGLAGFNKLAVVKELRADLAGSPAFVEMFLNEARLAARLTHPNVVHTYGANDDGGRLYIAMEYLDGQPWSRVRSVLWSNRSLPLVMHLKVLVDTLAGLHYAHELRDYDGTPLLVVHRDMSPQNTFVTYDGQVKLVDFGVARAVNSQHQDRSMFVGKLAYSAPEQLSGAPMDRRADIFAVGVMLWEALAGRRLMEGQERSEQVRRRASEPAPPIRNVVPTVPRTLADVCDRALALDPADRYATAAEFREALLAYFLETSQTVDGAQLGQLVANAFREDRQIIQNLIERHLMPTTPPSQPTAGETLPDTVRPPPPPPGVDSHTVRADLSELASVSRLDDQAAMFEASNDDLSMRIDRSKQRKIAMAGVAIAALAIASWLLLSMTGPQPDTVVARPLPPDPAQGPAPRAPEPLHPSSSVPPGVASATVELKITARPESATIYLDGTPLTNPYVGRVPADGDMHLIRVSAPGSHDQERVVAFDRDKALEFELAPRAQQTAWRRPRRAGPSPRSAVREARSEPAAAPAGGGKQPAPDVDFDSRIMPDPTPRKIDEEDPY